MKPIKLNNLAKETLSKKEMNEVKGGAILCGCGCVYAGSPGGSSTADNGNANAQLGDMGGYSPVAHAKQKLFIR